MNDLSEKWGIPEDPVRLPFNAEFVSALDMAL